MLDNFQLPNCLRDKNLSRYQAAIVQFMTDRHQSGDLEVDAVPGSGKTTTAMWVAEAMAIPDLMFAAFNTHIAEEIGGRLRKLGARGMEARTGHSLGYQAIRKGLGVSPKIVGGKYNRLVKEYVERNYLDHADKDGLAQAIVKLVSFVRKTLTNPTDQAALTEMIGVYGLEETILPYWAEAIQAIAPILELGKSLVKSEIDFDDMIWMPAAFNLQPAQYARVIVDECQDLSAAMLDLLLKIKRTGGRAMFVGDRNQSIFGFARSHAGSMDDILSRTGADRLPLSICYRCPEKVVALAATIFPGIEPRPYAPQGLVGEVGREKLTPALRPKDMVLCRTNAPLVNACFEAIRSGKRAHMRGRDIGYGLIAVIRRLAKTPGFAYEGLEQTLNDERDKLISIKTAQGGSEAAIEAIHDRFETIFAVLEYASPKPTSVDALCRVIENLFSDDNGDHILYASVHRAKGLEADRVYILRPDLMPPPWAKTDKDIESEKRVNYVAVTRAQQELWYVTGR
jgi:DNA helicase-2/ATP-dependent DNA helicase PcrA